jgi:hypothetical protein
MVCTNYTNLLSQKGKLLPLRINQQSIFILSLSDEKPMPEFARHIVNEGPHPLSPLLNSGEQLPAGLTPQQRHHLTSGRLAKDFAVDLLIKKKDVEESYGMSIKLIS